MCALTTSKWRHQDSSLGKVQDFRNVKIIDINLCDLHILVTELLHNYIEFTLVILGHIVRTFSKVSEFTKKKKKGKNH